MSNKKPIHEKPRPNRMIWYVLWVCCNSVFWLLYRIRREGMEHIPDDGPILFVSNHQCYFDPLLIGCCTTKRPFRSMARSTLFRNPVFAWVIDQIGAFPVERGQGDTAAIKKCIRVLQQGQALVVYPEGTRTNDGSVHEFKSGVLLLIRKAKPQVVPVAIAGAHRVWPKGRSKPRLTGRIGVKFGQPIPAEQLLAMDAQDALKMLQQQVDQQRQELLD